MNDDIRIEIEDIEEISVVGINEEMEKPKKGIARFTVSLDPPVVIKRRVLVYSDGRVYLDE